MRATGYHLLGNVLPEFGGLVFMKLAKQIETQVKTIGSMLAAILLAGSMVAGDVQTSDDAA